ncbi:MAG: glycosyltransferase [Gammaproteobacteria bacterium]|nr:glycosyltransferase [Gammaproteobacteria bacterium]
MKIVHYLARVNMTEGGLVSAVLDICRPLAAAGHEVVIITYDDTDIPGDWGDSGTPQPIVVAKPTRRPGLFNKAALLRLELLIKAADVLHLHTPWEITNVQIAAVANRRGIPYVLSAHGMLDDWSMAQRSFKKRLYLAMFGRRLLERAGCVHCTATAEHDQARKWFPRGRAEEIPLMFDLEPYRKSPRSQAAGSVVPDAKLGTPMLLFLSRLHYGKGVDVLIKAADLLRRRNQPFRLVIAGSGDQKYMEQLRRSVESRDLESIVTFVGSVTGAAKLSLYQAADMLVLPTIHENFGLVIPEALACKTPVVTTKGVAIWPELEKSGGVLIAERTAISIAEAITILLADPERLKTMAEAGHRWVLETFGSDQIMQRYAMMYEKVMLGEPGIQQM